MSKFQQQPQQQQQQQPLGQQQLHRQGAATQQLLLESLSQQHQWLKSINIWDEKYDYVMHDDHWLTSKWSADCEQCRLKDEFSLRQQVSMNITTSSPMRSDLNGTFDLYRSALAITPQVISKIPTKRPSRLQYL